VLLSWLLRAVTLRAEFARDADLPDDL